MPIANYRKHKQQQRDQQQTGCFRGIDPLPWMFMGPVVLASSMKHGFILRREDSCLAVAGLYRPGPLPWCYTTRRRMPDFSGTHSGPIARFGVFELNLAAGELRKSGARLRLQEQPFQVLSFLIERSGDVVTRDELRQKLWPADTFVDFDHSLNTAVNKLREVLGDSAASPRYIETLARRGYRFIAPVQLDTRPGDTAAARPLDVPKESMHPELEVPIPRRGLSRGLFALIQTMYLIFYLAALFRLHVVQEIADSFLPGSVAAVLTAVVMVTAGVGIPLRCYMLSAVGFDYQRLGEKFQKIFPYILALDQLWAVAPFLLIQKIGLGAAFAASAGLLYVPFSERTLIRMAYVSHQRGSNPAKPALRE